MFVFVLTCLAIAFTYFEALLRVGSWERFADEEGRLNSMGNLLEHIGYPRDIWIDFADEAFELLRKLGDSVHAMDGTAADILLQSFNDMGVSMAIITYFKASSVPLVSTFLLTKVAPCQRLGTVPRGRLQTLRSHGRRQGVLCQQH